MKKYFVSGVLAVCLAILSISCGKAPQAEIDSAKAAVDSAKAVGADVYLAETFTTIQDSLNAALENIEQVKSKGMFKNFDNAKTMLASVKTMADQAVVETEVRKNQVKEEVSLILTEIEAISAENIELLAKAPKGKDGQAALDEIKAELEAIDASIAEAKTLFDGGNYMAAKEKLSASKSKDMSINEELKAAISKTRK